MGSLIAQLLQLYLLVMIGRLVFDYFFRRFIPPLRIGSVSLDMSFLVVIILIQIAIGIFSSL
jgi:hypothetical protein